MRTSVNSGKTKTLIFTDLDGTLLDPISYSYTAASPLVTRLCSEGIPIIFCSSKTRFEQEIFRRELGIGDPFIVEDGGAIYINREYFSFTYKYHRTVRNYHVIELGLPYREIRKKLKEIRQKHNLNVRGFGDMDALEIANLTGLDLKSAKLAKKREYEETLNLAGSMPEVEFIVNKIQEAGLRCSLGTRFYGVSAHSDKGKATKIVTALFQKEFGEVQTIGIGDSLNDVAMLSVVDLPVLVQKPGNRWANIDLKKLYRVGAVGPQGWIRAIEELLNLQH